MSATGPDYDAALWESNACSLIGHRTVSHTPSGTYLSGIYIRYRGIGIDVANLYEVAHQSSLHFSNENLNAMQRARVMQSEKNYV